MSHPFVHLHVHTQYSILDGQASVARLVDKAMGDGMPGIAVTDHGVMFAIKEFINYLGKKKKGFKGEIKKLEKINLDIESGTYAAEEGEVISKTREKNDEKIYELKRKLNFKPIIGCEVYVARRGDKRQKEGKQDQSGYHLILLAKNECGYHNLVKIVSRAWTDGFYMRPRTDRADLEKFSEGLICCSACLGGEVAQALMKNDMETAEESVLWHKSIFGEDYYLEMQLHKATVTRANHEVGEIQEEVNRGLVELSKKHGVKLIASNDVHFVDEENAEAHDRLICLSTGRDLDDENRMLYTKQEWMKTSSEMAKLFPDHPEALANTIEICDKVECYAIDNPPIMPTFEIPVDFGTEEEYRARLTEEDLYKEFTEDENGNVVLTREQGEKKIKSLGGYDKLYRIKFEADYLAKIALEGAKRKYGDPLSNEVRERMNFELYIMKTMGFPGYFLIVQDFISVARNELGVSVGPGRGSAAGSAVAYCLGITLIDPIKYDLLFERFLNPDRISLPDIDVDFDDDGRGRVLNWVTEKYGKEKVAHIITFGTMATKSSIKDVARVQKLPLAESDRLCKLIPDRLPNDLKMNLPNAIKSVPELTAAEESPDPTLRDTIKYARMLEGNVRNTGVHACGIIICRDDITDWVPVSTADDKESGEKMLVTQYEGSIIEDTGLIKMDFLGLKTLSIIKDAQANIKQTRGEVFDIEEISIDDPATYKLYSEGRTIGTFQFESAGMQKYLRDLQPSTFEDLIAMNALYRPGPMDYIPDFVDRKHGRKPIEYDIPVMEKYLKDTYGITVYQEQVMLLSRLLADFTRGESDSLRKAMGKKLRDKLDEMKPKFISGGKANGHDEKVLDKIWGDWEKFASYAFNKSHATCYSWIAYQTAYLKANYPSEYMAALLSRNLADIKSLSFYMNECNRMGIKVLGPDINESRHAFSANTEGHVRFGMGGIKGVGDAAVASIVDERERNGAYTTIENFMERVNFSSVNRKCLESIAYAGGFDAISGIHRSIFFAPDPQSNITYLEMLIRYGQRIQAEKNNAQQSLFGGDSGSVDIAAPKPPIGALEWSTIDTLKKERDVIGLYLSAHPLNEFDVIIKHMCKTQLADLSNLDALMDQEITVAGMVTSVQNLMTKTGKPWGKFILEDYNGAHEFMLFGKDYESFRQFLYPDYFIYIKARVQEHPFRPGNTELKINSMTQLSEVRDTMIKELTLHLHAQKITSELIQGLAERVKESSGSTKLRVRVYDTESGSSLGMASQRLKVSLSKELVGYLDDKYIKYTIS
ncbi:MAG: DNA polymerase III subunit alpha [Rikenellaceae bacterium]